MALQVVDRHQRQALAPGQRLGHGDAHQQRAGQARPLRDRHRVHLRPVGQAGALARLVEDRDHPAQVGAGSHLGHDAAGGRVERHLAGHDVGDDAPAALDDRHGGLVAGGLHGQEEAARPAHVPASSKPVVGHPARVLGEDVGGVALGQAAPEVLHVRQVQRLGRHDERVLAVVGVVARAHAHGPEAEALVEAAGGGVAESNLQRRDRGPQGHGQLDEVAEQPAAESAPSVGRQHREGGDVGLVDHEPETGVGDDPIGGADHQVVRHAVRLELTPEGVRRPGRGEGGRLDGVHGRDVLGLHALHAEPHRRSGDHPSSSAPRRTPRGSTT